MKQFNYTEDVKNDVVQYIKRMQNELSIDWTDEDEVLEACRDDRVFTGYGDIQRVTDNMDLLDEALFDQCFTTDEAQKFVGKCVLEGDWKSLDETIREYVLLDAVRLAMRELGLWDN